MILANCKSKDKAKKSIIDSFFDEDNIDVFKTYLEIGKAEADDNGLIIMNSISSLHNVTTSLYNLQKNGIIDADVSEGYYIPWLNLCNEQKDDESLDYLNYIAYVLEIITKNSKLVELGDEVNTEWLNEKIQQIFELYSEHNDICDLFEKLNEVTELSLLPIETMANCEGVKELIGTLIEQYLENDVLDVTISGFKGMNIWVEYIQNLDDSKVEEFINQMAENIYEIMVSLPPTTYHTIVYAHSLSERLDNDNVIAIVYGILNSAFEKYEGEQTMMTAISMCLNSILKVLDYCGDDWRKNGMYAFFEQIAENIPSYDDGQLKTIQIVFNVIYAYIMYSADKHDFQIIPNMMYPTILDAFKNIQSIIGEDVYNNISSLIEEVNGFVEANKNETE